MMASFDLWFHDIKTKRRGQEIGENSIEYELMAQVVQEGLDVSRAAYSELRHAYVGLRLVEERMRAMHLSTSMALTILISMHETPGAYAVLLAAAKACAVYGIAKSDAEIVKYLQLDQPWSNNRIQESLALTVQGNTSMLDDFAKFDTWLKLKKY